MTDTARPDSQRDERDTPYRYTAALAAADRGPLAGPVGRRGHLRGAQPGRPAGRAGQGRGPAEALRAGHVPVPVRHRAARRAPAGLHRHRRVRPVQADDRAQRAARPGLRRVRPARRAVRRADRAAPAGHHRGEHRDDARAAAPAGAGARPPPQRVDHRPGVLPLDPVDLPADLQQPGTTSEAGRARPIAELEPLLASGADACRRTCPASRPASRGPTWTSWTAAGSSTRTGWPTCRSRRSTGAPAWAPCWPTRRSPPRGAASAATSRSSSATCASG